jgi:serine/threonine protein kinase
VAGELQPGDPQTIGPYRLVGRLGQGGMGQVFLGVSPGGRPVAVKAIRAELAGDPQFRVRFGREVAAARKVSGVFTAMVVDADIDGPVAWLATAYVPGPSLAEAIESHGPLPEESLLTLAAGLAESLKAIHAAGVVHRDLKPSNVLLAEDGPRVIDFGISRAAAESTALTQTGLVVGSPGFMSPEQAIGGEIGPSSDIFSLGAVLAFAATGQGPFGSGTTVTLLYRIVHGAPDLDQVPATVRPLIERCLAKDPAQRPTADGLLSEVGAVHLTGNWLPDPIIRTSVGDIGSGPALPATRPEPAGPEPTLAAPGLVPVPEPAPQPDPAVTQTAMASPATPAPGWDTGPLAASAGNSLTVPGNSPGDTRPEVPPGGRDRPRRRLLRPLVLGWVIGAVIVASGATAFALTSFTGHTPTPGQSRPAALTSSPAAPTSASHTAAPASASPSSNTGASQPASAFSSPSVTTSPSGSPSPSASPSASGSPSPSATLSPSASASAPASASASAPASSAPPATLAPSTPASTPLSAASSGAS